MTLVGLGESALRQGKLDTSLDTFLHNFEYMVAMRMMGLIRGTRAKGTPEQAKQLRTLQQAFRAQMRAAKAEQDPVAKTQQARKLAELFKQWAILDQQTAR
jgi:hypothetical protein